MNSPSEPTISALLFDIDGVLYQQGEAIDGAAEVLKTIADLGIPHLYLTNTTSRSREQLAERLQEQGIPVSADEILTPALAATQWLQQAGLNQMTVLVPEAIAPEFSVIATEQASQSQGIVLGDLGFDWQFERLNQAFQILMARPDSKLIGLGMTRYFAGSRGLQLDVGPMVKALEFATGKEAVIMGKPSADFFQLALQRLGIPAQHCLMIGDDRISDVVAAQQVGIHGCLVRTGKYRSEDESANLPVDQQTEQVIDSIADLPALLSL